MNKLNLFLEIWDDLSELFVEDVAITLFNTEEIVAYRPGRYLDTGAKIGDKPNPQSNVIEALTSGRRVLRKVSREVFGVPFVGIAYPLKEDANVIGCLAVASSIERHETLINSGESILAYASKISDVSINFSAAAEELAGTVQNLNQEADQVRKEMTETNLVTGKIKDISIQSNILGLNASIEASRAGAAGRGFAVVAEEIRKLADYTKQSTLDIENNVKKAQFSVNTLISAIQELAAIAETQAMGATEIADSLKQIEKMVQELVVAGQV